ncbi:ATP-binding protein [Kitasatospora indigofera]|uniref:ATP-binding protein n=1 Tax=Kitasatospora indigofera TaxID=67307 RepID=A0A919L006_9ACTN|nr:ATP/GTP-binding protein [Kitasatospora indigofera]GHH78943.1 ATP-binding protein [Kitasatospora indigofera]
MSPYAPSDDALTPLKIVIAGGFGVGKTTMVGAVSEIEPLSTEETLTIASAGLDRLDGIDCKATTTVTMDFGRITFPAHGLVLLLFGTPGQERFWFMWDDLAHGAVGAIVLVDTRRLQDAFPAVEFFERRATPFLIAVNHFDGTHRYTPLEVREALGLRADTPVLTCDARSRESARAVLTALVGHAQRLAVPHRPLPSASPA